MLYRYLAFLLIVMNYQFSWAQLNGERDFLLKFAQSASDRFEKEKAEALALADEYNLPVKLLDENGASVELMKFENGFPVYYTTYNSTGAIQIKTFDVYPGGQAGLNLTGLGQNLAIWDQGKVRDNHQELAGRVTQMDAASNFETHSTHVAGTMIAAGVVFSARGMAYQANLNAYDWNNDVSEMSAAAANGLNVSNHSYGIITGWRQGTWGSPDIQWHWFGDTIISPTEDYFYGYYSNYTKTWDSLTYLAPEYTVVVAAGNNRAMGPADPGTFHYYWNTTTNSWQPSNTARQIGGGADGYDCMSHYSLAKNVISVGALTGGNEFYEHSGWGPTDDGRIKPDVVAKGEWVYSCNANGTNNYQYSRGTSMASPMVSGSVGILLQHQNNLNPGQTLKASTIKALITHSANDTIINNTRGPDYRSGWGLMNTRRAAEIMTRNQSSNGAFIIENQLTNGQEIDYYLISTGAEPIRATLSWTDLPGEVSSPSLNSNDPKLVNDLDMRISNFNENTFFPYILDPANPSQPATTGDNFRDNLEMIHILSPGTAQVYRLRISHKGSLQNGNQYFSLVVSGANLANCPDISQTQSAEARIVNSVCNESCIVTGGMILAPQPSGCPSGTSLQFRTNGGQWSLTPPAYNQQGPSQLIQTRCACNEIPFVGGSPSTGVYTRPGECTRIVSSADSGPGTLRTAIRCAPEFSIIEYDMDVVSQSFIINPLIINKTLTLIGPGIDSKPEININFANIIGNPGMIITGENKKLYLENIDLITTNNINHLPIINVETGAELHTRGSVLIEE